MNGIKIRGAGHAVPQSTVTNDDLARRMDTSDAWIVTRTGICRRHHCTDETQTGLCIEAARAALARSGARPEDIGVCLVATMSPERMMPATACMVQGALGLPTDTLCFDMNAACSGFVFALHTAGRPLAAWSTGRIGAAAFSLGTARGPWWWNPGGHGPPLGQWLPAAAWGRSPPPSADCTSRTSIPIPTVRRSGPWTGRCAVPGRRPGARGWWR